MTIIAEIGTAHSGSIEKAKELIDVAADAGADCVKFQWVYAEEILHPDTGFVNLPGGSVRLYDRFKELEVDPDFFAMCKDYTHEKGLLFACSPFGLKSLKELVSIEPDAIKIASPEVNHYPLLEECSKYYGKIPLILSSGVSKLGDIEKAIDILVSDNLTASTKKLPPLTLLHCLTFYPAPESEYNVRCVDTLGKVFGIPTGISDHSLGEILVPVLATAMGGTMIEKHITLSRKTDGLDDPVALEGSQFARMVHSVKQTEALINRYKKDQLATDGFSDNVPITAYKEIIRQLELEFPEEKIKEVIGNGVKKLAAIEKQNYGRTNRSLHYTRSMKAGDVITERDIAVLRTEKVLTPGISPEFLNTIIGARVKRNIENGCGVSFCDLL